MVFDGAVGSQIVDDYSTSTYGWTTGNYVTLSDTDMSAAFGQTTYKVTVPAVQRPFSSNFVGATYLYDTDGAYCAGCNGSFQLGFLTTSISTSNGVFAVGLDIDYSLTNPTYHAFVTFGDGSILDYLLPTVFARDPTLFWGITSDLGIMSIHFGDDGGAPTQQGSLIIDNLTIASSAQVPEPTTFALLGLGIAGIGFTGRKKALSSH